jgi:TAG lipase / lysophosphatidylethanolamine acyltransferase
VNLLRSGLVRNLANITSPKLYNRSFAGTKYLIEEYVAQIAEVVEAISELPTSAATVDALVGSSHGGHGQKHERQGSNAMAGSLTTQMKLDFIHDTRQAFGRSTLVLQGGAIFGLYHLGVVKALFLRGLLPRIITGIATGALVAALVAIHPEDDLLNVLKGEGIDLSAFAARGIGGANGSGAGADGQAAGKQSFRTRWQTLLRRIRRFRREGYFLDVSVLEECVRANVGDLTFEEAYNRSKRVLNITVATKEHGGVPTLLNYLTAPNVVSDGQNGPFPSPFDRPLTVPFAADLDGGRGLQRLVVLLLRIEGYYGALQGRPRQCCPMGARE